MSETIQLTEDILKKLKTSKIIKQHSKQIVSIDFSNDGSLLYTADQSTLNVYATQTGQNYRKLFMKSHQIEALSHTHNNMAVLVATKKNHLILYWSIHENKIIKMFKGHNDTINNVLICPSNDIFMTNSHDSTLRLWNLNSLHQDCQMKLDVQGQSMSTYPVANFDPTGIVFAVAWSQQQKNKQIVRISLYDTMKCQTGPFSHWKKDYGDIRTLVFSNNGELIALSTADNSIVVMDAYQGAEIYVFKDFLNQSSTIQCCFCADTNYLVTGSQNGTIHIINKEGKQINQLQSHVEKASCVKFSPAHCLLVSAGRNIAWWLPQK